MEVVPTAALTLFLFRLGKLASHIIFTVCVFVYAVQCFASTDTALVNAHSGIRILTFADKEPQFSLGPYMQFLIDDKGQFNLTNISRSEINQRFNDVNADIPNFGLTDKAHWLRFGLSYQGELPEVVKEFEIANPLLESIDVYIFDASGNIRHIRGGFARPLLEADVVSRHFVSRLRLKQGETQWVYIKVQGISVLNLPTYLWDIDHRRVKDETQMIAFGAYYGLLTVMFLYNMFLYFSTRFKGYLFYICFIAFNIMVFLANDGLMREYFTPNHPWTNARLLWCFSCCVNFSALLYIREFSYTRTRQPRMDKVLLLIMALLMCGAFLTVTNISLMSSYIVLIGASLTAYCALTSAIISVSDGYQEAKLFLVAWASVIIGSLVLISVYFGLIPANNFTLFAAHLGSSLEVLLFSFVLGNRINIITSEKLIIEKLAKSELKNSHRYLDASHRLKDDFIGSISEEFVVPIFGVINRLAMLDVTRLDQEQNSFINITTRSARSMMFMVEGLIRFTEKNETAYLSSESFGLRDRLEYIRLRYWAKSRAKGLDFQYYIADNVPESLVGDASRLQVVIYNLLDNAVKYTHQGSVIFTVNRRLTEIKGHTVTLEFNITDTGPGIPEDKQDAIFEPFSMIEASAFRSNKGIGIGLALSKKTSQIMRGDLTLKSQCGRGTQVYFTVTFELEAKTVFEPEAATVLQVAEPKVDFSAQEFNGHQILIAEDNPTNQTVMKKIIEKLGCVAIVAKDGNEALRYLSEQSVDLILMDCQMPNKDGYQATREIRVLEKGNRHIPIIAVTANAMEGDKEKCLEAGMDDYLKKPVKLDTIKATLDRYL
ncbi:MAG: hypothetical protein COB04_00890 [Gammaproteobacteria bacterium]|nr:MAG: hypothetical protein COB04_00890 [Gammaproteobacteria bacterium]